MSSTLAPRTTASHPAFGLCASVLLLAGALAIPSVSAQVGPFGTQVHAGDFDYAPLAKKDAIAVTYSRVNLDGTGNPQADCIVFDTTGTAGIQMADLHVSNCEPVGKPAGSLVDSGDKLVSPAVAAVTVTGPVTFVYADADGSSSYSKGEAVYAKNFAGTVLLPVVPGDWTLRLPPTVGGLGGTMVKPSDADAVTSSAQAKTVTMTLVQRDDKIWYLVPAAATPANGAVTKNTAIPVLSIRLSNTAQPQANVQPTAIVLGNPDLVQAGKGVSIVVPVLNGGSWTGPGLLVTKLGGQIVDARMTPILSPTESTNVVVTFTIPAAMAGTQELSVNDIFQVISVKGTAAPAAVPSTSGSLNQEQLGQTIATLQARIDALESKQPSGGSANPVLASAASPGFEPVLFAGALVAVALVARRRA